MDSDMQHIWPRWPVYPEDLQVFLRSARETHGLGPSEGDPHGVAYDKPGDTTGRRIHTTLGRFVRKRRPDCTVDDKTLAIWADVLFGGAVDGCPLEFYLGEDVSRLYHELARDFSITSCMGKQDKKRSLTSLYDLNPETVGLLVLPGRARALLWSKGGKGFGDDAEEFYLDRAYGRRVYDHTTRCWDVQLEADDIKALVDAFAFSRWRGRTIGSYGGQYGNDRILRVTMRHSGVMPYMDTFDTGDDPDAGEIIDMYSDRSGCCTFEDTCGGWEGGCCCDSCGGRISDDNQYYHDGETYCESCFYEHHFCCCQCGETYDLGEVEVEYCGDLYCEYCASRKGLVCCEDCGEVYESDDMVYVDDMGFVCDHCFYRGNYFRCDRCGEVFEGSGHEVNESVYCSSCAEEKFYRCECCREYSEDLTNGRCESCHEKWEAARDAELEELRLAEVRESVVDLPFLVS